MATNTLATRSDGDTITEDFFNDYKSSLSGTFVPRNTSGVPEGSTQSCGSAAFPWSTVFADGLVIGGSSIDLSQVSAPATRIVSGATRLTSGQPLYIVPAGSGGGASVTLVGASESLVYDTNGTTNTLEDDIVKSSLTLAPSTNNTCTYSPDESTTGLLNTSPAGGVNSREVGEDNPFSWRPYMTIGSVGSEISSLDGKAAAFECNGEYFIAEVDSGNLQLVNARRGWFFGSTGAPVKKQILNDADTITLLKLGWVFVDADGATVDVTYTEPTWSHTAPTSPNAGDYWFDLGSSLQKRYSGSTFETVSRVYAGMFCSDDTDCLGARAADFDFRPDTLNTLELEIESTEKIKGTSRGGKVSVYGSEVDFSGDVPRWNITTDLASSDDMYSATEQSGTMYCLYISDEGETIISDMQPHDRRDLGGLYHPHNPWRMVGRFYNDSSSDISRVGSESTTGGYAIGYNYSSTTGRVVVFSDTSLSGTDFEIDTTYGWHVRVLRRGMIGWHSELDFGSSTDMGVLVNCTASNVGSAVVYNTGDIYDQGTFWYGRGNSLETPNGGADMVYPSVLISACNTNGGAPGTTWQNWLKITMLERS